jgi:hypothetical protein
MPPHDRDPDMAAATGCLLGLVISVGGVAIIYVIAAWGEPAVRYAAWAALTIGETMR